MKVFEFKTKNHENHIINLSDNISINEMNSFINYINIDELMNIFNIRKIGNITIKRLESPTNTPKWSGGSYNESVISIYNNLDKITTYATLFHELIHHFIDQKMKELHINVPIWKNEIIAYNLTNYTLKQVPQSIKLSTFLYMKYFGKKKILLDQLNLNKLENVRCLTLIGQYIFYKYELDCVKSLFSDSNPKDYFEYELKNNWKILQNYISYRVNHP